MQKLADNFHNKFTETDDKIRAAIKSATELQSSVEELLRELDNTPLDSDTLAKRDTMLKQKASVGSLLSVLNAAKDIQWHS